MGFRCIFLSPDDAVVREFVTPTRWATYRAAMAPSFDLVRFADDEMGIDEQLELRAVDWMVCELDTLAWQLKEDDPSVAVYRQAM